MFCWYTYNGVVERLCVLDNGFGVRKGAVLRILLIGDVFGKSGLDALLATMPGLIIQFEPAFIVVNAENVAAGKGINVESAKRILDMGANVITLGNHAWNRPEIVPFMEREPRILRPANYPPGSPGQGHGVFTASNGAPVGVANLMGRALMDPIDDPFRAADKIIDDFRGRGATVTCIDFHAEATSEKQAFGLYVDGRVSAVVGTHTHVQTADERILENGTAYITDLGMTGPQNSVIGVDAVAVIERFKSQRPQRYDVAGGPCMVNGVVVTVSRETGHASAIERINMRDIGDDGY